MNSNCTVDEQITKRKKYYLRITQQISTVRQNVHDISTANWSTHRLTPQYTLSTYRAAIDLFVSVCLKFDMTDLEQCFVCEDLPSPLPPVPGCLLHSPACSRPRSPPALCLVCWSLPHSSWCLPPAGLSPLEHLLCPCLYPCLPPPPPLLLSLPLLLLSFSPLSVFSTFLISSWHALKALVF